MIYFLQPCSGGPIKIGCSGDVPARVRQLEAHYGRPLALLATLPGDRDTEAQIHERFAHLRFGRTEQFRPATELMDFIGRPLLVGLNPDAVEAMPAPVPPDSVRIRVTPAFKAWLQDYANERMLTMTDTIIQALIEDAVRREFKAPPKG